MKLKRRDCLKSKFQIVPIFAVPALNVANSKTVGEFCHIMVVYLYPLGMMLQTGSVWLFMLITTERYLAVVQPLRVGVYCSPSRARLAILSVRILFSLYISHFLKIKMKPLRYFHRPSPTILSVSGNILWKANGTASISIAVWSALDCCEKAETIGCG